MRETGIAIQTSSVRPGGSLHGGPGVPEHHPLCPRGLGERVVAAQLAYDWPARSGPGGPGANRSYSRTTSPSQALPCSRSTATAIRIRMRLVPTRPCPTAPWRGQDRRLAAWILACCSRCRILQRPNPATGWLAWIHGRNSGGFHASPDPCPACIHITNRCGGWRQRLSVLVRPPPMPGYCGLRSDRRSVHDRRPCTQIPMDVPGANVCHTAHAACLRPMGGGNFDDVPGLVFERLPDSARSRRKGFPVEARLLPHILAGNRRHALFLVRHGLRIQPRQHAIAFELASARESPAPSRGVGDADSAAAPAGHIPARVAGQTGAACSEDGVPSIEFCEPMLRFLIIDGCMPAP